MDGIHDMGGMHGFGRVPYAREEPVFTARWQARVFGMVNLALGAGVSNIDALRHAIERIPPSDYLRVGYYGRWLAGLERRLDETGVVPEDELRARLAGKRTIARPLPAIAAPAHATARRPRAAAPRFAVGARVRTRNLHPAGHTRLPGYARGKRGVIAHVHPDAWVRPDTYAHGRGEHPEALYNVRFDARELWGEDAETGTALHLDCFEHYLEPTDG